MALSAFCIASFTACPKETKEMAECTSDDTLKLTLEETKTELQFFCCCICSKKYPNIGNMVRHIKYHLRKKTDSQPEQCSHCDKVFSSKQQLTRHEATHKDTRAFQCEECLKLFKTADGVKRHMYVHSDEKPFSCRICRKEFKAKHLMRKHEETHSEKKNYECQKCGKRFKARNSLRDHLLVHNGTRPYKCDECDQAFYRRSHLATHKIVHSEVKPFSCKVCEKCFGRREHLRVHERIHSGEKPFKCTQCERSFNQQAGLQAHLVSHSDDRPHACSTCKKTFKYQSQIKHHACKPEEIVPCSMVDVRVTSNTMEEEDSEPTTVVNNTLAENSQEGLENAGNSLTTKVSDLGTTSEDTIILIQIENTGSTDDTAMSVDVVTTRKKDGELGLSHSMAGRSAVEPEENTIPRLAQSDAEVNAERGDSSATTIFGTIGGRQGNGTMGSEANLPIASQNVENVDFSATNVPRRHSQEAINTLSGSTSAHGDFIRTHLCSATGGINAGTQVSQGYTTSVAHGYAMGEPCNHLTQHGIVGWSQSLDESTVLVGDAGNTEENTMRVLSEQLHQPSAVRTAGTIGMNPGMMSGLPAHIWNHS